MCAFLRWWKAYWDYFGNYIHKENIKIGVWQDFGIMATEDGKVIKKE